MKIVTTYGRPFLLLDSEGFREILSPIYNALQMSPITSRNIMDHIRAKEMAIKEDIKALVKRRLISLKIDVATRLEKSILGINLQMFNSTLQQKVLAKQNLKRIALRIFNLNQVRYYKLLMHNIFN